MYEEFLKQIEDFMFIEDKPEKADVIFVPGNGYPQMAEKAAELYRNGFAPKILPSGRYSITAGRFTGVLDKKECYCGTYKTEWDFLKDGSDAEWCTGRSNSERRIRQATLMRTQFIPGR